MTSGSAYLKGQASMTLWVYSLAYSSPGLDAFELSFFGLGPTGPDEPEDSL